jgi:hypothetical protein
MQRFRQIHRRRAILHLIDWLVLILFLLVWIVAREPVPPGSTISYSRVSDHILVQLAKLPDHAGTSMYTTPLWTLYGDGTLIFRTDPDDNLWRAHLAPGDIQALLAVIIHQEHFFDSTVPRYGSLIPPNGDDERLLTIAANGQQKYEVLLGKLPTTSASDIRTSHVFAIEEFLLAYQPVQSVLAAPNPDPDRISQQR